MSLKKEEMFTIVDDRGKQIQEDENQKKDFGTGMENPLGGDCKPFKNEIQTSKSRIYIKEREKK